MWLAKVQNFVGRRRLRPLFQCWQKLRARLYAGSIPKGWPCDSRTLHTIAISFSLILVALVWLKELQVEGEVEAARAQTVLRAPIHLSSWDLWRQLDATRDSILRPYHFATSRGLHRRIDDPSFWFVLAAAVAAWCLAAAASGLRVAGLAPAQLRYVGMWRWWAWVLASAYLILVLLRRETFFRFLDDGISRTTTWIQYIEGWLILWVIIWAPLLAAVSLTFCDVLDQWFRSHPVPPSSAIEERTMLRAGTCVVNAGYAPLVALILGMSICIGLNVFAGMFAPLTLVAVIIVPCQLLPFAMVSCIIARRLGRRRKLTTSGLRMHWSVGPILTFLGKQPVFGCFGSFAVLIGSLLSFVKLFSWRKLS